MASQRKNLEHPIGPQHVYGLLSDFDVLMVGTYEETGAQPALRARPMAVAHLADDCSVTFLTRIDTSKVSEAMSPRRGTVSGQKKREYVSAIGTFELRRDPERAKQLWSKAFDVWFDGPEDPGLVLMIFHPEQAELWDNTGGKGLKYLFEAARSLLGGEPPKAGEDPEQHERVTMH